MRLLLPGTVGLIDDALLQSFQWCLLSLIGSISSLWKIQFMNRNSSSAVRSFFSTLSTHTQREYLYLFAYWAVYLTINCLICAVNKTRSIHTLKPHITFPFDKQSRRLLLNTACRSLDYFLDPIWHPDSCPSMGYLWKIQLTRLLSTLLLSYFELSSPRRVSSRHSTGFINASWNQNSIDW